MNPLPDSTVSAKTRRPAAHVKAKSIAIEKLTRDPLWLITLGMGAFFAVVAALLAIG
jgi:hypothetical protein